jgi:hypothetical protein
LGDNTCGGGRNHVAADLHFNLTPLYMHIHSPICYSLYSLLKPLTSLITDANFPPLLSPSFKPHLTMILFNIFQPSQSTSSHSSSSSSPFPFTLKSLPNYPSTIHSYTIIHVQQNTRIFGADLRLTYQNVTAA